MKRALFRWPVRDRRANAVTYTFRLAVLSGEATTPIPRRTYSFDVVFDRSMDTARIARALKLRADEIAGDMATIMAHEVMAGITGEMSEKPPAAFDMNGEG